MCVCVCAWEGVRIARTPVRARTVSESCKDPGRRRSQRLHHHHHRSSGSSGKAIGERKVWLEFAYAPIASWS